MKITCTLLITIYLTLSTWAGTGAILPDGSRLVRTDEKSLHSYDLEKRSEEELRWPAECVFSYPAIATTKDQLLVGGGKQIYSYDPATKKWAPFWKAPDGTAVDDIAFDAKNDRTIVLTSNEEGNSTWWVFAAKSTVPVKLFNRRAAGAESPVFDKDGILYFTVEGDLWKGSIEMGDHEEVPFVLSGARIWPLALRETDPGNSSGSSAKQIIPLGKWIILELSRYGGSGWGNIIRIPNTDAYEAHLPLKWDELEECSSGSNAAVSGDGKKAFTYINGAGRWFEIDFKTGALLPLPAAK